MSRQKQEEKGRKFLNGNYALIPVLFVLCVVPLIMRLYVYDSGLEVYPWFPNRNEEMDVFLYWKSIALVVAAVIMAAILGYCVYNEWKAVQRKAARIHKPKKSGKQSKENKNDSEKKASGIERVKESFAGTRFAQAGWLIPLAAFAVLVILSTLFSEYRSFGFNGIHEQFESVWVILAYCIVAVYTFYFIRTKEDIAAVEKGLFVVLALLGILGITQLTGHDFWETAIGRSLFVPKKYSDSVLTFNFSGSGNHQVYLTFYNPNYVGMFAALMLPISIMLCVGNKQWMRKAAWGILSIVIFLCALGSGSKAFLISLTATAFLGIILYGRKMLKYLPIILMYGVTIMYVGSVYMNYVNVDVVQYLKNALTPVENAYAVDDFTVSEDGGTLTYRGEKISMICETGSDGAPYFQAKDASGTELAFTMDENNVIHFEDERFVEIAVSIYGGYDEYAYIAEISAAGHKYAFSRGSNGYTYLNFAYRADEIIKAEAALFANTDRLFTGRGYLWSRTIPLLKNSILLGTGADSYVLAFPQNDYVARINAGYQDSIITKPHCMYLQMGVQYGVVALLCFLALAVMYAVQTIKLCWRVNFKDLYSCLALGMLMGITGYGIMGISNDSCVALSPMAWVLLGVGFAVNQVVRQDLEERKAAELECTAEA